MLDHRVLDYIESLQTPPDGVLGQIQREATEEGIPIIPPETVGFLSFLLCSIKPVRVLEIGTAVGFSAGLIAGYLPENGTITTIDRYDYMIQKAKENFKRMEIENKVEFLIGDAGEILPDLTGQYDLIFLDAAKAQYIHYYPHLKKLLKKGGVLLADDVLQGGATAQNKFSVPRRQRTTHKRMRHFLWEITHDTDFQTAIIPLGDGLAVCYKKEEAAQ